MTSEDKKKIAVIVISVAVGLVASILVGKYIQDEVIKKTEVLSREYEKTVKPLQQEVQSLRTEMVEFKKVSSEQIAQAVAAASAAASVEKKSSPTIVPQSSLAIKTPPGKRAITVQMDSLPAVGGLINPGDYVDILGNLNVPKDVSQPKIVGNTDIVTAMIFQNVLVLAIGTNINTPGAYDAQQQSKSLIITFALDPEEAGLLTFIQQNGKLQLALRPASETQSFMLQASNWQTLADYLLEKQGTDIGGPKSRAQIEPADEETKPYIQVIRGGREL